MSTTRRRILIICGLSVGGAVAIGAVAWGIPQWNARSSVLRKVAALRAAGEPVDVADIVRLGGSPSDNAARYLNDCRADLQKVRTAIRGAAGDETATATPDLLSDDDAEKLRAALATSPDLLKQLERASQCRHYAVPYYSARTMDACMENFFKAAETCNSAIEVLDYVVSLAIHDGDRETAMRHSVMMIHLANFAYQFPTLGGAEISVDMHGRALGTADRVLRAGPISASAHELLERELRDWSGTEACRRAILTERASILAGFSEQAADNTYGPISLCFWLGDYQKLDELLDCFAGVADIVGLPFPQVTKMPAWSRKSTNLATVMMNFNVNECIHLLHLEAARVRCLRMRNAIAERGADVQSVEQLSRLPLPPETLLDPFTGQRLIAKPLPAGWLIYSVGPNLKDDGGQLMPPDNGYSSDQALSPDVGFGPSPVAQVDDAESTEAP